MSCDEKNCNEPETTQFKSLSLITLAGVGIYAIALLISPYFWQSDPDALIRYTLLKMPQAILQSIMLLLGICVADYVMPSHSLECIAKEPMSNAVFYSAFVLSLALVMALG